jgi:hypothetical protein
VVAPFSIILFCFSLKSIVSVLYPLTHLFNHTGKVAGTGLQK